MLWTRWIILGIPAVIALTTWWSAREAAHSREVRGQDIVLAYSDEQPLSLNPFAPLGHVDREITQLLQEPLLRIGPEGRLEGGLAEHWFWSQLVCCWFANDEYATKAAEKLKKLSPEQWAQWQLTSAEAVGNELRLLTETVDPRNTSMLREAIAEFGPLPVETIRVQLNEDARKHHEFFMENAVEGAQVKQVWYDGPNNYEIDVSGEAVRFFQELDLYYRNHPSLQAKLRVVNRKPILARPLLDLVLKEGASFQDGTPVTSSDVESTVRLVLRQPWPFPGRESLRNINGWDVSAPRHVRISFREIYGPSIMGFVQLPVLPATWIEQQQQLWTQVSNPFLAAPPPGTGKYKAEPTGGSNLILRPIQPGSPNLEFIKTTSQNDVRMGFAMKSVDVFWPNLTSLTSLSRDADVSVRATAPRSQMMVLWNCRRAPLNRVEIRQALGQGINREALVQEILHGMGTVQEGIFQPGLWLSANIPAPAYDQTAARQQIYDAGWVRNEQGRLVKDDRPFKIELLSVSPSPLRIPIAQRLKTSWEELGIEVTVTDITWEQLLDQRLPAHQYDAALIEVNFETSWDQHPFWHSTQARTGLNFSGISDPQLDRLLETLRIEYSTSRTQALARELETRLMELRPVLPLIAPSLPIAAREQAISQRYRSPEQMPPLLRRVVTHSPTGTEQTAK